MFRPSILYVSDTLPRLQTVCHSTPQRAENWSVHLECLSHLPQHFHRLPSKPYGEVQWKHIKHLPQTTSYAYILGHSSSAQAGSHKSATVDLFLFITVRYGTKTKTTTTTINIASKPVHQSFTSQIPSLTYWRFTIQCYNASRIGPSIFHF